MTSNADPQQVFRSPLPVGTSLIVVFVPSKDRDDNLMDQEKWVDEVLSTLGRHSAAARPIHAAGASGATMTAAEYW